MKDYLPESMRRCPPGYARGELERAMEEGTILTARAVRCDETHDLIIDLGCAEGRIPRLEAAEGVADGRTREIAKLCSRGGRRSSWQWIIFCGRPHPATSCLPW